MFTEYETTVFELERNTEKYHQPQYRTCQRAEEQSFTCRHCGNLVCTQTWLSGVQNRNHCPLCLWSRHVDHFQAGDRLSACKGTMQPIGLTVKHSQKKYAAGGRGELMLIHSCNECGKLSINRLAADDSADEIYAVFRWSLDMEQCLSSAVASCGIQALGQGDEADVLVQLFGRS